MKDSQRMLFITVLLLGTTGWPQIQTTSPTESLKQCIRSHWGDHDSNPTGVRYPKCEKEFDAWMNWCRNGSLDGTSQLRCEQQRRDEIDDPLAREWERAHPSPPQQDPKMEAALHDLQNHLPLPGMPSLKKPVFLAKGSTVCSSAGALGNPNRDITLAMGACSIVPRPVRVSVLNPDDAGEYIRDHYFGIVSVVRHSDDISDARVQILWTNISALTNNPTAGSTDPTPPNRIKK